MSFFSNTFGRPGTLFKIHQNCLTSAARFLCYKNRPFFQIVFRVKIQDCHLVTRGGAKKLYFGWVRNENQFYFRQSLICLVCLHDVATKKNVKEKKPQALVVCSITNRLLPMIFYNRWTDKMDSVGMFSLFTAVDVTTPHVHGYNRRHLKM